MIRFIEQGARREKGESLQGKQVSFPARPSLPQGDKWQAQKNRRRVENNIPIMQSRHQQNLYKGNLLWSGMGVECSKTKSGKKPEELRHKIEFNSKSFFFVAVGKSYLIWPLAIHFGYATYISALKSIPRGAEVNFLKHCQHIWCFRSPWRQPSQNPKSDTGNRQLFSKSTTMDWPWLLILEAGNIHLIPFWPFFVQLG